MKILGGIITAIEKTAMTFKIINAVYKGLVVMKDELKGIEKTEIKPIETNENKL